ncbi:MAG: CBS domain-containing protein [Chloroflexia bacterium]
MYAREIMTREVITVSPDDTVRQLARVLTEGESAGRCSTPTATSSA